MDGPALSPQGQAPGPPGYRQNGVSPVGVPQPVWNGNPLPPPQRPSPVASSGPYHTHHATNGPPASPSYQLHQQAHASAIASSSLPHNGPYAHVHPNGSMPPPSPHHHTSQRPNSQQGSFGTQRPSSSHSVSGTFSSPTKQRNTISPHHAGSQTIRQSPSAQLNPFSTSHSPNTSFPPPQQQYYHQQAAGHSPVKQLSSSPQPYPSHSYSHSPAAYPPAVTPSSHAVPPASTPMTNLLRPSPGMASSPIPPVAAHGPVIPQKHDTPRPISRDSIGETPVFPPVMALSPTATDGGKGMSIESGQGGLGTGTVPVKKVPEMSPQQAQAQAQAQDASMSDV